MKRSGRWLRSALSALAAGLVLILAGDRSALTSVPVGIDPLQVLDNVVRPNVMFVLDSSLSMGRAVGNNDVFVGGDDTASRFYQVKKALRRTIDNYSNTANIGLVYFAPDNANKVLTGLDGTPPRNVGNDIAGGPLVYVSGGDAAIVGNPENASILGFFSRATAGLSYTDYNDNTCAGGGNCLIWNSFNNTENGFDAAYPTGCAAGSDCRYYMKSRLFRDGVSIQIKVDAAGDPAAGATLISSFTCKAPPASLFPDDAANGIAKRPCFEIQRFTRTGGFIASAVYYYSSGAFSTDDANKKTCDAIAVEAAPACNDGTFSDLIRPLFADELPLDPATGAPTGLTAIGPEAGPFAAANDLVGTAPNAAAGGIRLGNTSVPLGEALKTAKTSLQQLHAKFPIPAKFQQDYIVVVTADDSNCGDDAEKLAADMFAATDPHIETLVVALAPAASALNADLVGRAGSGGSLDAFVARSISQLQDRLDEAMQFAYGISKTDVFPTFPNEFSDQQSITESIFELTATVKPSPLPTPPATPPPSPNPNDPDSRYTFTVPLLLQSTFELQPVPSPPIPAPAPTPDPEPEPLPAPTFKGHLRAFRNESDLPVAAWGPDIKEGDAGKKLLDRVVNGLAGNGMSSCGSGECTYPLLTGNNFNLNSSTLPNGTIQRRIYTTTRNGVFPYASFSATTTTSTAQKPYLLWPNAGTDATLDTALGIDATQMDQTALTREFQACLGSILPAACTGTPAQRLTQSRTEARQMILAYHAGAEVVKDSVRLPKRDGSGSILYKSRGWILAESTLSAPAVVVQPVGSLPGTTFHRPEYVLFRDGPRTAADIAADNGSQSIPAGFGLKNPDKDAGHGNPDGRLGLKPVMSVVYHGANDGLHAFRAGPNCPNPAVCAETGGEEMWAFVPFDQLGKLRLRMKPQTRDAHVYMVAAPIRFSDVFVPTPQGGTWSGTIGSTTVQGDGKWRTLIFFGRGIAGTYLTALDITAPGPYTRAALATEIPAVVWSRGNPDTQDGTAAGTKNGTQADFDAFATMGQTWSVPSIARVDKANHGGRDFVAYVGSGFPGSNQQCLPPPGACPGTTFYELDVLNGGVVSSVDVGIRAGIVWPGPNGPGPNPGPNALVASPAVFSANQLVAGFIGNPAGDLATLVYIGDSHGRLFRFSTTSSLNGASTKPFFDAGGEEPINTPVALLNYNSDGTGAKPHIYLETGYDNRVRTPSAHTATPPFYMYGLRDDGADTATVLFKIPFPTGPDEPPGYRGTVQPTTAFNTLKSGRVFFAGVQFYRPDCLPRFDSLLFGLTAGTGDAAYDWGGSSVAFSNERITAIRVVEGQLVVDTGLQALSAPAPPKPPTQQSAPTGQKSDVYVSGVSPGSAVCR